jgi:hypothetical protein
MHDAEPYAYLPDRSNYNEMADEKEYFSLFVVVISYSTLMSLDITVVNSYHQWSETFALRFRPTSSVPLQRRRRLPKTLQSSLWKSRPFPQTKELKLGRENLSSNSRRGKVYSLVYSIY